MNKSTSRNVYALRGTPFVLARGHRLYARSEQTVGHHGVKVICDKPVLTENSLTVKVQLDTVDGPVVEQWGGKFDSEFVEKPASVHGKSVARIKSVKSAPNPRYTLVHPTCGVLFK
jgi:hypothetical protein